MNPSIQGNKSPSLIYDKFLSNILEKIIVMYQYRKCENKYVHTVSFHIVSVFTSEKILQP